ncbi:MAG: UDP-2,3-diacylglucosamine diphosphatase [Planctomycetota bacterium]|nr:UDP-2,3-diacylglucosamine diphosphatase [Planctomycetota bacterium]
MKSLARVQFAPGTVIIGDLHLDLFDPDHPAPFAAWCRRLDAPRLVILGDLFEFWVGRKQLRVAGARDVMAAMSELAARGTTIDVLWGNRDFLLDRHFERASSARVHRNGLLGEHAGGPTLVLHGDELCTLDVGYQRFKRIARAAPTRWLATHLPFERQKKIAAGLRSQSVRSVAAKAVPTKSMQASAADQAARSAGASVLVCGHAHVFRDEPLPSGARWKVIDGWEGERDALVLEEDGGWNVRASRSLAPVLE